MSCPKTTTIFVLFLSFSVVSVSGKVVTGWVNGILTLPCTYMVYTHHLPMCWILGRCRGSKYNNEIIRTDGQRVTWRKSDRYQLLGNISQGDVSLTITGVTKEDEGTYCCRVEFTVLFNDLTKQVEVKIKTGVTDSLIVGGRKTTSIGNIIRGILVLLFPLTFLLIFKYCSLLSY
ncbi:hepatitis A virus cellular receptor 2 homolog [Anomaloglossus baeobatrachus]|uniref:hepatitis A virus cellular receptor 2 homolog n=1 Tax=Anomaloglossus baeobatrachus TaxID=238106 RepID=UPI003F504D42